MIAPARDMYRAKALRILREGDPVSFIADTFSHVYEGDPGPCMLFLAGIGCQSLLNSAGIQPEVRGASKENTIRLYRTMFHLLPEEWKLYIPGYPDELYFNRNSDGMVIFLDDMKHMDESVNAVINSSAYTYQRSTEHRIRDKTGREVAFRIPARCMWWITMAGHGDPPISLSNRLTYTIEEGDLTDDALLRSELSRAISGGFPMPEDEEVQVCREIFRILKETPPFIVSIPFAGRIEWQEPGRRSNISTLLDIIKGFTAIRFMQRKVNGAGIIESTEADFMCAKELWESISKITYNGLTQRETALLAALQELGGEADIKELQGVLKKSRPALLEILNGRDHVNGLLKKVPLSVHNVMVEGKRIDGRFTRTCKKIYVLPPGYDLSNTFKPSVTIKT